MSIIAFIIAFFWLFGFSASLFLTERSFVSVMVEFIAMVAFCITFVKG